MNKKLLIILISTLCIFVMLLNSCSNQSAASQDTQKPQQSSNALERETSDTYIKPANEYPKQTEAPESTPAEKTVSLEVNGEKYTAQYESSEYNQYNNLKYNKYSDGDNTFEIYEDSNTLKDFNLYSKDGHQKKTFEECKQVAIDYARQFISVDDYKFTFQEATANVSLHFFDFTRYIDDTPTDDTLGMAMNTDGEILSFWFNYSEAFSDGDFDINKVRSDIEYFKSKEVHDELDGIAKSIKNYSSHQYFSNHLVSLGGKEYGLEYVINVDTREKNSDGTFSGSGECLTYVVTRK